MQRRSYASIELKDHPEVRKYKNIDFKEKNTNNDNDLEIVEEIINFKDKFNLLSSKGTGEWAFLQKKKQNQYINELTKLNKNKLANIFANMFRNDSTYGYLSPSFSDIKTPEKREQVLSNILCNIDTCIEFTCLKNLSNLTTKSAIGAPYGIPHNDGFILPDTPRHFYYSKKILDLLCFKSELKILEIGGGYGGLAKIISTISDKNLTYCIIDLLPGLLTSFYFLKKSGIKVNLINSTEDLKEGSVNLLPFQSFLKSRNKKYQFNLVFNSRSFCEMSLETLNMYFEFINMIKPEIIYHENSNYLLFPESIRHIELMSDQFPISKKEYKLTNFHITPFTGGDGRYREYVYKKII